MRTKIVKVNDKDIIVKELRVKELKDLGNKYKGEIDKIIKANSTDDLISSANDILGSKIIELFPQLTQEDVDNSFPSELEELIGGFIEVNFTGVKKAALPIWNLISQGLQKK